jgi:aspartyl/glutamyl-tRNA(Asn/Gln) amidotransferase C subunit
VLKYQWLGGKTMITKDKLKNYAGKLMFDMNDEEYETLQNEFDIILKYMDLIGNIDNIENIEPMTFPYELDSVELRNDAESRNIEIEEALSNTGSKKGREIRVPKVVD